MSFAHKIKKHAKEKHGFEVNLIMPIGGNPNRIAFVSTAPSLAGFGVAAAARAKGVGEALEGRGRPRHGSRRGRKACPAAALDPLAAMWRRREAARGRSLQNLLFSLKCKLAPA